MKEPYIEGSATHDDPESCAATRESGEALTGTRTGTALSREIRHSGALTPLCEAEGHMGQRRQREPLPSPARSETRRTYGSFLCENRESPASPVADGSAGRAGKAERRTPAMNEVGQSDRPVVPTKPTNKASTTAAESVERRGLAKGNTGGQNAPRTQSRTRAPSALDRVRHVAIRNKQMRFTALLHHVDIERLRGAFHGLQKNAAPDVDGVTWKQYAEQLEDNLRGKARSRQRHGRRILRKVTAT